MGQTKDKITCTIDKEANKALDKYCEEHDSIKSKVVNKAITLFLKENGVMK